MHRTFRENPRRYRDLRLGPVVAVLVVKPLHQRNSRSEAVSVLDVMCVGAYRGGYPFFVGST